MSKGSSSSASSAWPTTSATTTAKNTATSAMEQYTASMTAAMNAMMQQMVALSAASTINSLPDIDMPDSIDWTTAQEGLESKARMDETINASKKVGRTATVLSSPLLDEDDAETTRSLLAGK